MILDGQVVGEPLISYTNTKSAVEAIAIPNAGMTAYATDTAQIGYYNGSAWMWTASSGSFVGNINIASGKTLTVSNSITLTGTDGGTTALAVTSGKTLTLTAADDYNVTIPATGTAALLQVANIFTTTQTVNPSTDVASVVLKSNTTTITRDFITFKNSSNTTIGSIADRGTQANSMVITSYNGGHAFNVFGIGAAAGSGNLYYYFDGSGNMVWGDGTGPTGTIRLGKGIGSSIQIVKAGSFDDTYATLVLKPASAQTADLLWASTTSVDRALKIDVNGRLSIGSVVGTIPTSFQVLGSADIQHCLIRGHTTQAVAVSVAQVTRADASSGVSAMLGLTALGSGSDGDGGSILLAGKSSTTAAQSMGALKWLWASATHASRKARITGTVYDTAERTWLQVDTDGTASTTTITASQAGAYATTAVDLTLTTAHHWVTVTSNGKRITLPAAATASGREYMISALADNVIVDANASELIDGALTQVMGLYDTMQIKCTGTEWVIV